MQPAPPAISQAVSRELAGEAVLWAASPERWAYAAKTWRSALMGIPFTAFAIFWTWGASHAVTNSHHPAEPIFGIFFPLWGLMFVGFGLSMLLSPLIAAHAAANVYYAVTERRAIIFEKRFRLRIRSFPASAVANYERSSAGGRSGKIVFSKGMEPGRRGTWPQETGFIGLADYAPAEQALNKLLGQQ
jgi:hypothetical protein